MKSVTEQTFEAEVLRAVQPVLVEFQAPWCGYCRRLAPVLERLELTEPQLAVVQVNVDEEPQLEEIYQIEVLPTLLLFQAGEHGAALVNPASQAQLEQWLLAQLPQKA